MAIALLDRQPVVLILFSTVASPLGCLVGGSGLLLGEGTDSET